MSLANAARIYEEEEWRPVLGYEGYYEVSSFGRVRSLDRAVRVVRQGQSTTRFIRGHILRARLIHGGYAAVSVWNNNVGCSVKVAVLVCEAFHGPRPPGYQAAHEDGVRTNDQADNLSRKTPTENAADKKRHGTIAAGKRHGKHTKPESIPRGEESAQSRLTTADVLAIRAMYVPRVMPMHRIAKMFGVSKPTVWDIIYRRTWIHV